MKKEKKLNLCDVQLAIGHVGTVIFFFKKKVNILYVSQIRCDLILSHFFCCLLTPQINQTHIINVKGNFRMFRKFIIGWQQARMERWRKHEQSNAVSNVWNSRVLHSAAETARVCICVSEINTQTLSDTMAFISTYIRKSVFENSKLSISLANWLWQWIYSEKNT